MNPSTPTGRATERTKFFELARTHSVVPVSRRLLADFTTPAGVGRGGKYHFNRKELRRLLGEGAAFLRDRELATDGDLDHTEARGCLADTGDTTADVAAVARSTQGSARRAGGRCARIQRRAGSVCEGRRCGVVAGGGLEPPT